MQYWVMTLAGITSLTLSWFLTALFGSCVGKWHSNKDSSEGKNFSDSALWLCLGSLTFLVVGIALLIGA